jgi:pyridinium-3,5-biscarboxylic acid mononucleotide sulfurtransferase
MGEAYVEAPRPLSGSVSPPVGRIGERVVGRIAGYGRPRAIVAFSGGVDSATVLALATQALGPAEITAVTAVSPSYPAGELEAAREVARSIGVDHLVVETEEVGREAYSRNDAMRCFHCKTELYATLERVATHGGSDQVVLSGANADDLEDFRPGLLAAEAFGVRSPLLEERVTKDQTRAIARRLGLSVAEKPALACLSSRVAFGLPITADLLGRIDRAERMIRSLGFEQVRVRHLGSRASVEVPLEDVPGLEGHPRWMEVGTRIRQLGWREVAIDPEGYRPGRMNAALDS